MYLKSLEMKGFKSFADRTSPEFEPGISVIVGPNGSGKSNISEAFLWVMGEQSPRNLRGSKMEDVIFAGSDKRGSLGMAEVSLSFDNSAGTIPLDYEEVVVTRQLFRSGESRYLLNRAPTRLLDIQELLSDFGVGRELTAVIGQNRLERVISSRPEERRAFIEEAAGLLKHRRRKDKALRKLDAVEQNMVRLGDIISEVKKQLRPLERQAAVAKEYRELEGELKRLQVGLVVSELKSLHQQWENRVEEEERIRTEFEEKQTFLKDGRQKQSDDERRAHALRDSLASDREDLFRLSSHLERLRSEEQLAAERLRFYLMSEGMPMASLSEIERRREERIRRLEELERQHRESREGVADLAERVQQEEAARYKAASDFAALTKRRNGLAEEIRQGRQQLKYLASQQDGLQEEDDRSRRQREADSEKRAAAEQGGQASRRAPAWAGRADPQKPSRHLRHGSRTGVPARGARALPGQAGRGHSTPKDLRRRRDPDRRAPHGPAGTLLQTHRLRAGRLTSRAGGGPLAGDQGHVVTSCKNRPALGEGHRIPAGPVALRRSGGEQAGCHGRRVAAQGGGGGLCPLPALGRVPWPARRYRKPCFPGARSASRPGSSGVR